MKKIVEFYVFDNVTGLDVIGPLEVFHTANLILTNQGKSNRGYRCIFSAVDKGEIRMSSGLVVKTQCLLGKGPVPDFFVVSGSFPMNSIPNKMAVDQIRRAAQRAKKIVSICSGALILAETGLLNNKKVATHWVEADKLKTRHPSIQVMSNVIYIKDGNIVTSAGVSAGIDLALSLVEEDHGAAIALDVARCLVVYRRRSGGQSQFSPPLAAMQRANRLRDVHDWIQENLDKSLSIKDVADYACMSKRNLFRVFMSETKMTPKKYIETLRLDRARDLLEIGDDSLPFIAESCGFGNENNLRRAFIRRFDVTPTQYRIHFRKNS